MTAAQLTDPNAIETFVRAGNAKFTLVSTATGTRFTYRVRTSEDGRATFVSVMNGPDNQNSFAYIGLLTVADFGLDLKWTRKSRVGMDAPSFRAFRWFVQKLSARRLAGVEFWHAGCCGKCGRELTVPESIATGLGPVCAGRTEEREAA